VRKSECAGEAQTAAAASTGFVMCGRFIYKLTWEELVRLYRLTLDQPARQNVPGLIGFLLLAPLLLSSSVCLAGPPFFTDDPVPVDLGRWEINNYSSGTFAKGAFAGVLPGVDANYGAIQNVQLHLLVPLALAQSSGVSTQWGLGDVEAGAKYRFLPADEKD
jgi:hypothetical protein